MTYNLTLNATYFTEVMQWANPVVGGWLGVGILISVAFIFAYAAKQFETKRAIIGAMFMTMITATYLLYLQLLSMGWWIATVVIYFISWLFFYLSD